MSLKAGTQFGPYEILSLLGAGGMGEVYRARDTKLSRDVALKVLPSAFARDAERMARFQREAQVLASLNHPNIAAIYGLEECGGVRALVMELVEGPTLAEQIASGPIAMEEALRVAREVAEALEAAHEKGIVHRDLKPTNVKVTPEGKVKVLDFGLAKALGTDTFPAGLADSPTLPVGGTKQGLILGTPAYMSPEQARGKPLDRRSDIWSFGCLLYETLTARQAFPGDSLTDVLAAVIEREPDWVGLPHNTPETIRALLRRCLQKDPKQRLHDIADARIEIEEAVRQPVKAPPGFVAPIAGRRWPLPALLLAAALLGAVVTWSVIRIAGDADRNLLHLTSVARLTHDPEFSESPTWSPDGKMLAFSSNRSGNYEIYVRRLEGGQEVNVSNDPGQDFQPDFSPDGNWIAFVSTRSSRTGMVRIAGATFRTETNTVGGDVWVVPALGGQARLLARDGNVPAWHPSGTKVIYVSGLENHRALMEVTAEGRTQRAVLPSESSNWEILRVRYSPSGHWITFEMFERPQVFLLPASGGSPRELLNGISHVWDPSGQHIYYCTREPSGGTRLRSVEINEGTGELEGKPKTLGLLTGILKDLAISRDGRHLAASEMEGSLNLARLPLNANGDAPSGPEEVLSRGQVYDRQPSVSSDGRSIAHMSNRLGLNELWILRLGTKRLDRLELPGHDVGVTAAYWFPDGQRLSVLRLLPDGKSSLWNVAADGSHGEELPIPSFISAGDSFPVSPDGRIVAYSARSGSNFQLFGFDLVTRQSHQLTSTPGDKYSGSWSPDGRWLVYSSNASGTLQLWKIAASGGTPEQLTKGDDRIRHVFYSPDGRWLYYQPNHQNIYRMPARGGPVQQVTHFPESGLFLEEPNISPDGRYLVYCRSNGGSSLWLLTVGTGGLEHE
jgi:eukaryotic-like serine/threonine-protein kinase